MMINGEECEIDDAEGVAWALKELGYPELGELLMECIGNNALKIGALEERIYDLQSDVEYWEGAAHDVESGRW